jgi:hypothetical protein
LQEVIIFGPIIGRVVEGDELTRLYPEVCWSGYYYAPATPSPVWSFIFAREEK